MMLYAYKAVSQTGALSRGQLEASNLADLEMRLQRLDLDLVSGKPVARRSQLTSHKVPRPELINFCFHLEQLTAAGVPILESLGDLRDSLTHPPFRTIVASLIESIAGGQSLSQAMAAHPAVFSPVFANLIRAGESSGCLPEVLANLTESLKWEDELAAHTQKLLLYPAFVGSLVTAATFFLMIYMVPQLKHFVSSMGQTLPGHSQLLFWLSDLLVDYWSQALLLPVLGIGLGLLALRTNPRLRQRLDSLKLQAPVVGPILAKIILARFTNTFAMLYAAGIPVLDAIRTTQDVVGNHCISHALAEVEQSIGEGCNLAGAFQSVGLFPPLIVRMLRVGENTGGLDLALRNVSYFYTRDVRESVGKAQSLIEPILTLLMGLLLGWVMLALLGPIYNVISQLKP